MSETEQDGLLRVRIFATAAPGIIRSVWYATENHEISEGYND